MSRPSSKYLFLLLATLIGTTSASAQDENFNPFAMAINMQGAPQFIAGGSYDVLVQLSAQGVSPDNPLSAMGVLITPPPGWLYLGAQNTGFGTPDIEPRGGSEVLEFAWINPPQQFPFEFAFTLGVPPEEGGVRFISGQALYRTTGPEELSPPVIVQTEGPDKQPPTIELIGDNPLEWPLGEPFVDPGYVATDAVDGDVTGRVQVTGVVDHTSEGRYTLNYTATDNGGNRSPAVTREVIIVDFGDNPPPVDKPANEDVVSGGGGGGNFGNNGRGRNRNRNRANDDDKSRPRDGRNANNARNNNNRNNGHIPSPSSSNLAKRLAQSAANNRTPSRPTQIVIPKNAPPAVGARMDDPNNPAAAGTGSAESDSGETPGAMANAAPGPRATPRHAMDYGEGEGESDAEMAMAGTVSTPAGAVVNEPSPGLLARVSGAVNGLGTRDYLTLGGIAVVLLIACALGAIAWKSAYRRTPRRAGGSASGSESAD